MAAKKKAAPKKRKATKAESAAEGEHLRRLAPERAVRSFINDVIASKSKTSEAGQWLSTSTKRATEAGVNIPAARIAARLYGKAKNDPAVARVLWEDIVYYLQCTDFDRIAPEGMFTAEEGGQKHKRTPKQAEMPLGEETGTTEPVPETQASSESESEQPTLQ